MILSPFPGSTRDAVVLRRVRARGSQREPLRARQHLERALQGVDWMPFGAGSSAVFLVRRLVADLRPGEAFGTGVSRVLRELARAGRRPWIHADAGAAPAVWFEDETEMAACLVRDWLRGTLHGCWWWPAVLAGSTTESWSRLQLLARGEKLVPVLERLAKTGYAVNWLRRMNQHDAAIALQSVALAYAVPQDCVAVAMRGPAPGARQIDRHSGIPVRADSYRDRSQRATARLLAIVPELEEADMPGAALQLLVWSLVAIRDSGWFRTPDFHSAVSMLIEAAPTNAAAHLFPRKPDVLAGKENPVEPRSIAPAQVPEPESTSARIANQPGNIETQCGLAPASEVPTVSGPIEVGNSDGDQTPAGSGDPALIPDPAGPAFVEFADTAMHEIPNAPPEKMNVREGERAVPSIEAQAPRAHTEYGGIFYLLNAALAMGLYCDFTMPRGKNLDLSPWDWLALVGRTWFGEEFVADPVWLVLEELAGRAPEDEPGHDIDLPPGWLDDQVAALDARLQLALDPDSADAASILVCRHRAAVEVTLSFVRVRLELAALPLDLRIVGLDRDPGWIPAAGRAVYFLFD